MATLDNYAALQGIVARWDRRLRLTQSVLWLPRAFIPGLLIGIALALVARTRPLWPPPTIALMALAGIGVGVAVMLAVIWLWRRSLIVGARRFDVEFGLGERVSTALELGTGAIRSNEELRLLQVADAHSRASAVRPGEYLPLRTRSRDWAVVLALAGLLALFLLLPNPQTEALEEDAQQEAAIDEAAEAIREITEEVAADTDLGNEERQALLEQLNQTLDRLEQPNISAEEAFASVSAMQAALEEQARQQQDAAAQNQAALQAAADALRQAADQGAGEQNAQAQEGAQTMQGALEQLTQNLEQFVQNAEQMSEQERQAAADALRDAAQALQQTNPEAAEALNQAADALENSDNQQTQDQLEQAQQQAQEQGEQGQQQEAQAQQSREQAQQAEQAAEQIAQQGEQQQGDQQQGQPQEGQQAQQGQQPQQGEGQQQGDQPGQNPGESGQEGDQQGGQQQPGGQQGNQPGEVQGSIQAQQGGGAGDDSGESTGQASPAQVAPDQNNNPDGQGESEYESVNVPRRIGGEGGEEIVLEPDASDAPVQEGEFAENPEGQVTVPYNQVFGQYQDAANRALEGGYVPLGLRDVVRDYFTALEPSDSSR